MLRLVLIDDTKFVGFLFNTRAREQLSSCLHWFPLVPHIRIWLSECHRYSHKMLLNLSVGKLLPQWWGPSVSCRNEISENYVLVSFSTARGVIAFHIVLLLSAAKRWNQRKGFSFLLSNFHQFKVKGKVRVKCVTYDYQKLIYSV